LPTSPVPNSNVSVPSATTEASRAPGPGRVVQGRRGAAGDRPFSSPTDAPDALAGERGRVARRYRRIGIALAVSDVVCISAALVLSYAFRFGVRSISPEYVLVISAAPVVWIAVFHAFGLYAPQHLSAPVIFRRIIGAASVGLVLLALGSFWSKAAFSRAWIGATWVISLVLELVVRRIWAWRLGRLRRNGRLAFRTLIVGTNDEAADLAHALAVPGTGFAPIGFVNVSDPSVSPDSLPVLGSIDRLPNVIHRARADCLFVASTAIDDARAMRVVTQVARQTNVEVRVSANLPQILTSRLTVQQVGRSTMALSLKPVRLTGGQAIVKRSFDLVLAGLALVATLPVWAVIALLIRMTSSGPVLFRQQRVTKGGRVFTVYKFRTMVPDGDRVLASQAIDTTTPFFKLADDPRVTPIGAVIRRLSLDELPQLLNVIKGDMSLVGPRPLPADQVAANTELLRDRHEVLAGVTGWWQINGRSDVTAEEALNFDVFYIENWSLGLDLYILLKTVGVLAARTGAR
jgi:exopolysaccharide biosynthesis polyprenyl glycosylphosphotransferase